MKTQYVKICLMWLKKCPEGNLQLEMLILEKKKKKPNKFLAYEARKRRESET